MESAKVIRSWSQFMNSDALTDATRARRSVLTVTSLEEHGKETDGRRSLKNDVAVGAPSLGIHGDHR